MEIVGQIRNTPIDHMFICFDFCWERSLGEKSRTWFCIYQNFHFFLLITGCVEGSETGHLDGNNSQCHFCNLLGSRVNWIHPKEYDLPQHPLCAHCHCWHDGVVQCSRQPFRLHPNEPSVQTKNQGSDLLPKCFCSTQAKAAKENKGIETRL